MELPIEVPLSRPVTVNGEVCDKLVFDELDIGAQVDFEDMVEGFDDPPSTKQSRRATLFLISRMTDVPEEGIRKIKASDYPAIEAVLNSIMEDNKEASAAGNTGKA